MTNGKLLLEVIEDSGITKVHIAQKAGISRERLYAIIKGSEVKISEFENLVRVLKLSNTLRRKIFLADTES